MKIAKSAKLKTWLKIRQNKKVGQNSQIGKIKIRIEISAKNRNYEKRKKLENRRSEKMDKIENSAKIENQTYFETSRQISSFINSTHGSRFIRVQILAQFSFSAQKTQKHFLHLRHPGSSTHQNHFGHFSNGHSRSCEN